MLDTATKRRIDTARDILVGKVPDPKSQVEQITIALIYKFMDDMDAEAEELGGRRTFFAGEFAKYGWAKLMRSGLGGHETLGLYAEAIGRMPQNPGVPALFRDIFKNAFLPYRDPETLRAFLKVIDEFEYDHSERLGDAFEYLLSVLGSQGDAGQFRTPRHIIDFIVAIVDPRKGDVILDPACGTAGFLISAWKHIRAANQDATGESTLTPDEQERLAANIKGYDISPDMVRLSLANMYLHGFIDPHIQEYDTLTSEDKWNEFADVILANPPFMTPKGGIRPHKRFSIQANRSEVLFVDYMAEHLTPTGRAGIIVPEGVIFQSGKAYKALRKELVEKYLVAVVSLPAGVFNPYSGVKTSVLILDPAAAKARSTIGFFKVANDGFSLGTQRREVGGSELPAILAEIAAYRAGDGEGWECAHGRAVMKEEIGRGGEWNLSGERYLLGALAPSAFPTAALAEVCDIFGGATPARHEPAFWEGGDVKWLACRHIGNHHEVDGYEMITRTGLGRIGGKLVPPYGLVLVTRVSVGKYAIVRDHFAINQDLTAIVAKDHARLLPGFLSVLAPKLAGDVERNAEGIGVRGVTRSFVAALRLPLPPLETQRELVAEVENYQRVIDGASTVLEEYRTQIPVQVEGRSLSIGELCTAIQYGLSHPLTLGSGVKTFRMNEIVDGRCLDRGTMKGSAISGDELNRYRLNSGDILFNRTNSFEHVGRTGMFDLDGEYVFASYLIRLAVDRTMADPAYVNAFMNTNHFQTGIKQYASRAIGQANINAKSLAAYPIPLPPLDTQRAIVAELDAERALVDANRELIARMEKKIDATVARVWAAAEPVGEAPALVAAAE